jgi:hypothetical protein
MFGGGFLGIGLDCGLGLIYTGWVRASSMDDNKEERRTSERLACVIGHDLV